MAIVSRTTPLRQSTPSPSLSRAVLRLPSSRASCRINACVVKANLECEKEARATVSARRTLLVQTMGALMLTSTSFPKLANAAENALEEASPEGPGVLVKAGKLGAILLIADVITGVVLGKSAFDIMNRDKDSKSSGGWKEALADRIMEGSSSGSDASSPVFPVQKTPQEWQSELSQEEYRILRLKGTERARTGEYDKYYPTNGHFKCAGCGNPLYSAAAKFDSGCGWPAFDKCYAGGVVTEVDNTMGMRRVEIMCANCGGHLGHVFEGERFTNTNERHCVNSVSVKFDPSDLDAAEAPVTK